MKQVSFVCASALALTVTSSALADGAQGAEAASGKAGAPGRIVFEVVEIKKAEVGRVLCMLYESKDTWLKKPLQTVQGTVSGKRAVCTFSDVARGSYAIGVLHDLDGDGDMDTNFLGIPKEGYCASRNARNRFSEPNFEDARFDFDGEAARLQSRMIN
jgi:uncharacterized protein (DUF2141 family)